jgi:membrane fusion protein, multidrug efflux system
MSDSISARLPRRAPRWARWGGVSILVVGALVGAACRAQSDLPRASAVPVVAETAARTTVPLELRAVGNVETIDTVAVKPLVGGELVEVRFREGTDVKAGEVLFTIDPRPYEAALHQAEANLARDEANAHNGRLEAQRGESLFGQGVLSREQFDALNNSADALDAAVRADRAAVEAARLNLGYCTIRSPIDGRTGSLLVQRGNILKAIDGGPLVVINRVDPVFVSFSVPERRLGEVKAARAAGRLSVEAIVAGEETRPLSGELTFLDNAVDRTTGTIRLKGTFANKERRLWPGQFVDVRLSTGTRPDVVVVPTPAIQTGQSGTFVFVVRRDLTVEARPVVVGPEVDGSVIVEKGVEAGEQVVTDGQIRLVPGAKVELKAPVGAPSPIPAAGGRP